MRLMILLNLFTDNLCCGKDIHIHCELMFIFNSNNRNDIQQDHTVHTSVHTNTKLYSRC